MMISAQHVQFVAAQVQAIKLQPGLRHHKRWLAVGAICVGHLAPGLPGEDVVQAEVSGGGGARLSVQLVLLRERPPQCVSG